MSALEDTVWGIWGEQGWTYGYKSPKLLGTEVAHQISDKRHNLTPQEKGYLQRTTTPTPNRGQHLKVGR